MPDETPQTGLSDNAASGLAYITIIPAIIFLVVPPYNQKPIVRFHSWQSIFLFIAWFVIHIGFMIVGRIPIIGWFTGLLSLLVSLGLLIFWIIVLIKAFTGERFKIPVIADLETFAVERLDQHDDPKDEQSQRHQQRQEASEPADDRNPADNHEPNVDHEPGDEQEDRLPGVEANYGLLVIGRDDQEDDRRDDGDVGKAGGGVVAKASLRSFVR